MDIKVIKKFNILPIIIVFLFLNCSKNISNNNVEDENLNLESNSQQVEQLKKNYEINVTQPAEKVKLNNEVEIVINVVPEGNFHINKEYPVKFESKLVPENAEIVGGLIVDKTHIIKLEEKLLQFEIPIKLTKPGKAKFEGKFRFGLCNEKSCLLPEEKIVWEIEGE